MKAIYLMLFTFIYTYAASQQLPLTSHNFVNPMMINPSFTGQNNTTNIFVNYRAQWVGFLNSPRTFTAGGQYISKYDRFAIGALLYSDFAGNAISRTGLQVPLSLHFKKRENNCFSIGFSPFVEQFSLSTTSLNNLNPNDPALINISDLTFDFNIGLSYTNNVILLGISSKQILESKLDKFNNLTTTQNSLKRHYDFFTTVKIFENNIFALSPSFLFRTIFLAPIQYEIGLKTSFQKKFDCLLTYRANESMNVNLGINLIKYKFYYSYDYPIGDLRSFSTGSHELTFVFNIKTHVDVDSDGDGVTDSKDKCRLDFGPVENNGCPWGDYDGDGITDNIDNCPDVLGPKENSGCPWPDSDNDGVTDNIDHCPKLFGPKENNGCPWPDSDNDGVTDNIDQCPNTFGVIENNGCPIVNDQIKAQITRAVQNLEFETKSDKLLSSSYPSLDMLAFMIVEKNDWKIKLIGHTDNIGEEIFNFDLSRKRAEAVKNYLILKGVSEEKIFIEYFGETKPIDSNDTPEGRLRNRRVEMVLVFN